MDRRFWIAVAGALVCGWLTTQAARHYLQTRLDEQRAQESVEVVIALTDIPLGAEIGPQQIALVKYPKNLLSAEMLVDKQAVSRRVALAEIPARTPVLKRQLAVPGALAGLRGMVKEGMRAVGVRVDEASVNEVAGKPGSTPESTVDVIAIMPPQLDGAKPVSKVILQNVRVLAGNVNAAGPVVWLEVTPAQAEKLKLAEAEGRLQLSLRNAADRLVATTPGATRRDVLADAALEQRAAGGAPRKPSALRNAAKPLTLPTATPLAQPAEKSVELLEGRKRTRVEIQ